MTLVIKEMAGLTVPKGLLDKIDMPGLIKGFKSDYDKLDDLKAARSKHEQRGSISQWWNSDELEDAQLDAAELQASFSKKLGQLMVISIEQSKLLTQQQSHLATQQNIIKEQASELASANKQLDKQQKKQLRQQVKLEDLINDYFELKGLTAKDAQKLIKIANEVKEMKTAIYAKFDQELMAITQIKDDLMVKFEQEVASFNSKLEQNEIELLKQLQCTSNDLAKKFKETKQSLLGSITNTNKLLDEHFQAAKEVNNKTNLHLATLEKNTNNTKQQHETKISELQVTSEQTNSDLSKLQATSQEQVENLTKTIKQLDLHHENLISEQKEFIISNHQELQAALKQTDGDLSKLQETSQEQADVLTTTIKQVDLRHEKLLSEQKVIISKNHNELQASLDQTDSDISRLQTTSQEQVEGLIAKIEQLDLQYEKQQTDQQELNSSNNVQFETALMKKDKQVKMLTIGLIASLIIGASSLGIVLYPLLSQLN